MATPWRSSNCCILVTGHNRRVALAAEFPSRCHRSPEITNDFIPHEFNRQYKACLVFAICVGSLHFIQPVGSLEDSSLHSNQHAVLRPAAVCNALLACLFLARPCACLGITTRFWNSIGIDVISWPPTLDKPRQVLGGSLFNFIIPARHKTLPSYSGGDRNPSRP